MPRRLTLAVTLSAAALLTACGGGDDPGTGGGGDQPRYTVVTGFYPLQYAARQVVGDVTGVTIESLATPGVDAHDLELTPRQVGRISDAQLVVFSAGMQPSLDEAVAAQAADHSLDVATVVELLEADDHEDHDHAEDDHDEDGHEGHDHDGLDPHFWLDPERYAAAGEAIAEELAAIDPGNADTYRANAEAFSASLTELDEEFRTGLAACEQDTLVTTHEAFGYLADRYGFDQVGITGISPEAEASPARMAEITRTVDELGISAIYAETSLGGDLADVIASETGAQVLVLDPIEGITDNSAGSDYFEVMRANLEALRQGQECG